VVIVDYFKARYLCSGLPWCGWEDRQHSYLKEAYISVDFVRFEHSGLRISHFSSDVILWLRAERMLLDDAHRGRIPSSSRLAGCVGCRYVRYKFKHKAAFSVLTSSLSFIAKL
jgi:hypothetical protein